MGIGGITDNRTFLNKADLVLNDLSSSAGYLLPAQALRFMRILIKESKIMQMATVTPMKSPKQQIEKIRFAGRVLRAGREAQPLAVGDRAKPDLSKVELDAQLFKAEVRLSNEVLEDSIERDQLRQTIMQLLGDAIARDMEEVLIKGDTNSADPFLAQLDGLLKQATSNVVDATGTPLTKTVFRDMIRALPSEFLRNRQDMRFLTSTDAELDYRDALADRSTVLGDKFLEQNAPVMYSGIPVIDVPLMPENLGVGSDSTNTLLLDPKNINVGIWRNIRIETDKLVSEGVLLIVATMRFDVVYAEETAVVKAINVKVA